jgi:dTDP-4-dehydrorhamnose reductase
MRSLPLRRPTLLLGSSGQISFELMRLLRGSTDVVSPARAEIDLTRPDSVRHAVRRVQPAVIVNAAGYTAVDRAESERDLCFQVNAEAPGVLAEEARACGAILVHYSTDYVFDGAKPVPYVETDLPGPLNIYGESKLAGERAVQGAGGAHLVLRTSWVYGPRGTNFPRTILRLARERSELRVVADQTGTPTSSRTIAAATVDILYKLFEHGDAMDSAAEWSGIYHVAGSGLATWYDVAQAVLAADPRANEQRCERVLPIPTTEFPTPARRPRYSVLDCTKARSRFGLTFDDWRFELASVISELA